jgi:hypothetical protein
VQAFDYHKLCQLKHGVFYKTECLFNQNVYTGFLDMLSYAS